MMRHSALKLIKNLVSTSFLSRRFSSNHKMSMKRIAVCQMTSVGDKQKNLDVVSQLVEDASKDEVQMIFFPEACDYIAENKKEMLAMTEPIIGGPTVNSYRELAKKHNVWLSMGGVHEKDESAPEKSYNTHIIINSNGEIVQTYRKLHLFDVEIPERNVRLKESDFSHAGSHIVTPVESPIGKIGLAICYDMRFPELSTHLAMMGADVLTYPSAFTVPTGEAHWEVILRARAIENQCFVIAAAQVGKHNSKRASYGRAMCVSPWGKVLADCGLSDSPTYAVSEINSEELREVRRKMPVFQHRRKNVYSLYALSLTNKLLDSHKEIKNREQEKPVCAPKEVVSKKYTFGHVSVPETCVFYKSELSYAFVNIRCVTPGHVLVAPVRLAERNKDLSEKEAEDFYKTIRLVQSLMERVHSAHSCTVTIQDGPEAGQTVKHLHCHIMPRKKGDFIENDHIYLELAKHDQLTAGHPSKPARTLEEMENEAKLLREELEKM